MSKLVAPLVALALVAGCSSTRSWISGKLPSGDVRGDDSATLGAPEADAYLDELYQLVAGDPATQAEIYADAESGHKLTPGPSTSLRFALVLATPGHSESDAQQAQSMLRELLTQTELLTASETALATVHLKSVENLMVSESEARLLRSQTSRQARTQEQSMNQRLATVEAENRRLRRELEDAESKLEAITNIERSIRDQE